jgi:hypothetical protein
VKHVDKRIWLVGLLATVVIAGCSSNQSGGQPATSGTFTPNTSTVDATLTSRATGTPDGVKPKPLEIVESGYTIVAGPHVEYAFVLRNPNPSLGVEFPRVRVSMRDAQGRVLNTADALFGRWLLPGETAAFAEEATLKGNGLAKVVFEVEDPGLQSKWKTASESRPMGHVLNTSRLKANKTASGITFTGQVENRNTVGVDDFIVSVILRDKSGRIVAGYTSYMDEISVGEKQAFTVRSVRAVPKFVTMQAYAQQWS